VEYIHLAYDNSQYGVEWCEHNDKFLKPIECGKLTK
jgi:hypothetical protein